MPLFAVKTQFHRAALDAARDSILQLTDELVRFRMVWATPNVHVIMSSGMVVDGFDPPCNQVSTIVIFFRKAGQHQSQWNSHSGTSRKERQAWRCLEIRLTIGEWCQRMFNHLTYARFAHSLNDPGARLRKTA
jgi:hypothetical protein